MDKYDFSGWATRNNLKCADGRTIMKDAFKHCDGQTVPLVWNHQHNDANNILGHALLENRDEGVYAYCSFNDTDTAQNAKNFVQHGDICSLSIYANKLKQQGGNVHHGYIREVSLVLAGANPGAYIDSVIKHGEESDEEAVIFTGEDLMLYHAESDISEDELEHAEGKTVKDVFDTLTEEQKTAVYAIIGAALETNVEGDESMEHSYLEHADGEETVKDVFETLSEKQKTAVYAIIGAALDGEDDNDEEDANMKHNIFEADDMYDNKNVLCHSDQASIVELAKRKDVGSLQHAMDLYAEQNELKHGFDDEDLEYLFPEFKTLGPKAPEFITRDESWIGGVMSKVTKSPISRIRTRQMDLRQDDLRAHGYQKKGDEKHYAGNPKLLQRTTDPQTVYRKDMLHRDDIIDITDFDVVNYQYQIMKKNMEEELALAFLIGDGRDDADPDKIQQEHIRAIWHDDDLYSIHYDVDIEAARAELQGTDTNKHFGENYIYAEAIITAALYSREQYKGSGSLEFYCTPHLLNVMLLARDLNGHRMYSSKSDLAAALNVTAIHTVEQFENKTRTTKEGDEKKLLGIFVNLKDYQVGSTKGGEITRFNQFDIDFNREKYLIETRLSGALTRVYSAICLEEPVEPIVG